MTHPETKKVVTVAADGIDVDALIEQFKLKYSVTEFKRIIDNLAIPAEARLLLTELLNFTVKAGTVVLEVGKEVIEVVKMLAEKFPNITAGIIIAVVLSFLVSCIPVFGPLLSWICTPLFLLVGVGAGIWKVMNADGNISPEEEKELEKLSIIITEKGEAEAGRIAETVIGSINRTKQSITDITEIFMAKASSIKRSMPEFKGGADFSDDSLFEKISQLDEDNIISLLVSGCWRGAVNTKHLTGS